MSDGRVPDSAGLARRLMRGGGRAALATSFCGAPYASLVLLAADLDASPLLLLSDLARHSRNIAFDPRVSLLFDGTSDGPEPLAGPRLTVLGQAEASADPRLLARFVARHPSSVVYAGFVDFRLYRVKVERGHLVAGFGRIEWIAGDDLFLRADLSRLATAEPALLARINADHGDGVARCAGRLLGRSGCGWRIAGIDPEGADLRNKDETARLDFPAPAFSPRGVCAALARLAKEALR
jgi:heme oxygenase (biliverdin-IX-beta and delta-forming)